MAVEKVFRFMCNSKEYLSADIIAMALLKQITLNPKEPDVVFGVMEVGALSKEKQSTKG